LTIHRCELGARDVAELEHGILQLKLDEQGSLILGPCSAHLE
jgi:hypothetical protein